MAVFCACMPNIRGLLAKLFPKNGFSWPGSSNPSKTGPVKMMPEPHHWENSQDSNDLRLEPGGIRVTLSGLQPSTRNLRGAVH